MEPGCGLATPGYNVSIPSHNTEINKFTINYVIKSSVIKLLLHFVAVTIIKSVSTIQIVPF